MHVSAVTAVAVSLAVIMGNGQPTSPKPAPDPFTSNFLVDRSELAPTGSNPYFSLMPGNTLTLRDGQDSLIITVTDETRVVDGVTTRIIEERETEDGELAEISRNFYAISTRTNAVYYFGEEVDIYKDGKIVRHEGAWLSGEDGARFGMFMPGDALLGARHYQEYAPGVALDRVEIVGVDERFSTPAGEFEHCIRVEETTPLEPKAKEHKLYAPGVGLLSDEGFRLVSHLPGRAAAPKQP